MVVIHVDMLVLSAQQEVDTVEHALPGGRAVGIGREGLALGEALLDARRMGLDEPPLAEAACAAAMAHPDPPTRKVLAQGPSLGPRMRARFLPFLASLPGIGECKRQCRLSRSSRGAELGVGGQALEMGRCEEDVCCGWVGHRRCWRTCWCVGAAAARPGRASTCCGR